MTDEQHSTVLRARAGHWFPLVPRPKPVCRPLDERVTRVCELARAASGGDGDPLTRAAEALNLAALIISDCGLPGLAHDLCRRQARLIAAVPRHDLQTAQLALQPLINIGRLLIRSGDPGAHRYFQHLLDAVASRSDTSIEGTGAQCSRLTASDADHRAIIEWLWPVVLADGTRALTRIGQWARAVEHLERYNGIGERLLDGRQVLILNLSITHDYQAAREALPASTPTTWEHAVKCCLQAFIRVLAGEPETAITSALAGAYAQLCETDHPAAFTTRLGLCARTLAQGTTLEPPIARTIISAALRSSDAYAAHDVLSDSGCAHHTTTRERNTLTATVQAAGISQGQPPDTTLRRLTHAVKASEAVITALLDTQPERTADWPDLGSVG